MKTHTKKRVEIIVEAPVLNRLLDGLNSTPATGYTVVPALAGKGMGGGAWRGEGLAGAAGGMVVVICIVDPAHVDAVLDTVYAIVSRQIGIVSVSDVEVIRADHF